MPTRNPDPKAGVDGLERLEEWCGAPVAAWRERWGVPALHAFGTVGSTNDVARGLAEAGAPEGTTVLAEAQTRGRGRRGRTWISHQPGDAVHMSMVARPEGPGSESVLSLRLGLAAARAVERVAPLAVGLKWPNDLVVDEHKVGGMLCEAAVDGGRVEFVVAGLGINVNQRWNAWEGELEGRAGSLWMATGRELPLAEVVGAVVAEWLPALGAGGETLSTMEIGAFDRRDTMRGRAVTVDGGPGGVVRGIDPDGALRLEDETGIRRVVTGTIRKEAR